jgi:hypothetical protein
VADLQEKGYANATINRELSALKRMFTLAIQAGKLLQLPHIPMLAEDNVRKGFFERAEFESVREAGTDLPGDRDTRVLHRLARQQRDPDAAVPPDRSQGRRHPPGTWHHEKPRRASVQVRGDPRGTSRDRRLWARHEALERELVLTPLVFWPTQGTGD